MQKNLVGESPEGDAGAAKSEPRWSEMSFQEVVADAERLRGEGLLDEPIFSGGPLAPFKFTALGWACHRLNAAAARRFLDLGASITALSGDGRTPTFIAGASIWETFFNKSSERMWENCLAELFAAGVNVNEEGLDRHGNPATLIEYAVGAIMVGDGTGPLEWLVSQGALARTHRQPKALVEIALKAQSGEAMALLLAAGLNVEGIDVSERVGRGEPAAMRIKEAQDVARERSELAEATQEQPRRPRTGMSL